MTANIGAHHIAILLVLAEDGGFCTGRIYDLSGITYCQDNRRMSSGACRSWLRELQRIGFVAPMDDQKPVAWVRTKAGTEFVSKLPASPSPAVLPCTGDVG